MQRGSRIRLRGDWPTAEAADRIVLAFDQRWRRRLKLTTAGGEDFLLDLAQASVLRDGDALVPKTCSKCAAHPRSPCRASLGI
jgi:urease accessory protein